MRYIFQLVIFFLANVSIETIGQRLKPDSAFVVEAADAAKRIYTTSIGGDAHLYNGVEYKYAQSDLDIGHPYFLSDVWEEGSIEYDGQLYESVEMLYNLVLGTIVIEHAYSHVRIELITEKIRSFTLQGHRFVRLADSLNAHNGFYDVLYDGRLKLYAQRKKGAYPDVKANKPIKMFIEEDQFFIYKDKKYFPVKSKSSIMNVLRDREPELKRYLAKNKIRFRENHEQALIQSVKFYEDSQKQP